MFGQDLREVKVVVDPASAQLLVGATLDYKDGLDQSGFAITNPNASRTCGCGQSFSDICIAPKENRNGCRRHWLCNTLSWVPLYLSSIEQDLGTRTLERARQLDPLVNGVSFSGQDGTIFCASPVEYPAQLLRGLSALDGVHSVVADRSCRVLRAPTVHGSSTATIPSTTETPQPTTTLGSIVRETTTTEALPVSNDELLLSVLESDPELTTMARLALTAGLESRLGDVVIVLAPVDGAFDEFGADLLAD